MPKPKAATVDEYLAQQPPAAASLLAQVREAIRAAIPDAEETISYGIPVYKINGAAVLYFAGWKRHFSIYPANERVVARFKVELAPYQIEKGTIRFPLSSPAPTELIAAIATFRADEAR